MLSEEDGWSVGVEELEKKLTEAHVDDGLNVKALVLINPGNPTGQVLTRSDLERLCKFCAKHQIVLLADEVYQRNVYAKDKEFVSTKKVALETPGCENLQLVSFHSTSKGLIGECGRRGGYMELHNIDPFVQSQLYKLASSGLCSNVPGQVLTSLMVAPPEPGDPSYDLFVQEETDIYDGLARRACALVDGLNSIDGITCQPAEGESSRWAVLLSVLNIIDAAVSFSYKSFCTINYFESQQYLKRCDVRFPEDRGAGRRHRGGIEAGRDAGYDVRTESPERDGDLRRPGERVRAGGGPRRVSDDFPSERGETAARPGQVRDTPQSVLRQVLLRPFLNSVALSNQCLSYVLPSLLVLAPLAK